MLDPKRIKASPDRRYVAVCFKSNWDGLYFRVFNIPKHFHESQNTAAKASSYYITNNPEACLFRVIPYHQYKDIRLDPWCP